MDADALEKRIRRLEDIEAIKALKARYCGFCDANYDPEGIASLFVEGSLIALSAGVIHSRRTHQQQVVSTEPARPEIRLHAA